jgi:hypothetical protein
MDRQEAPALVVLSTLFPSPPDPIAGVFIKERMFRVARHLPVTVISPQPWFPLQGLLRRWKPEYRPDRPRFERVDGIEIHRPRFFALPGLLRRFDGLSIAMASWPVLRRLQRAGRADLLDVPIRTATQATCWRSGAGCRSSSPCAARRNGCAASSPFAAA